MVELLPFEVAICRASGNRHLLLGNGFSRACRDDLFAYDALFGRAKAQLHSQVMSAFTALDTTDFEKVMRALRQTEQLVKVYSPLDKKLACQLKRGR